MSDRRPENPKLYEQIPCEHPEATGPHTTDGSSRRWLVNPPDAVCGGPSYEPADLIAAVRRGVESGTIKGEVGRVEGASVMSQEHTELLVWVSRDVAREIVRGGVDVLVIPVSDGGSET